eukprot:1762111-Rhodomonas_salina.3
MHVADTPTHSRVRNAHTLTAARWSCGEEECEGGGGSGMGAHVLDSRVSESSRTASPHPDPTKTCVMRCAVPRRRERHGDSAWSYHVSRQLRAFTRQLRAFT